MAEHTKGSAESTCLSIYVGEDFVAHTGGCLPARRAEESVANARRLAAAWNACDGIPTESLERGVVADLLAACEAVEAHLKETFPPYNAGDGPFDKVRAAIAAAKGTN